MSQISDKTKFEPKNHDDDIKIKCIHGKIIIISVELNEQYWDDGAHIEIVGCQRCAEENNMNWIRSK